MIICKHWFDMRKCVQLEGGSCYGYDLNQHDYTLVIFGMSHTLSCEAIPEMDLSDREDGEDIRPCLSDLCMIDTYYSEQILYALEDVPVDWEAIYGNQTLCPNCRDTWGEAQPWCRGGATRCEGEAPHFRLIK